MQEEKEEFKEEQEPETEEGEADEEENGKKQGMVRLIVI
jgi:hypothetical protein